MADHRRATLLLLLAALVVVAGLGVVLLVPRDDLVRGVVIDLAGNPIPGASVRMADGVTTASAAGTFSLRAPVREGWVRAEATGFLPRLRPAAAGRMVVLRLTPDDGHTISLVFGGDVMFGRRFFDADEDGSRSDGQLQPGATADDYARLLDGVAPALRAGDLTVVNLETPLLADPFIDPAKPRPSAFHPNKEFVFGSLPIAADALRLAGVDVTGIGNNHLYDGLEDGVRTTLAGLDAAGFVAGQGRAGGGMTEADAWAPAIVDVRGTRVAIVACTTIDGIATPPLYVASGTAKAGAAPCSPEGVRLAVAAARSQADIVVAMIHGGYEYDRAPTTHIRELSAAAREAGAALVVDHHPHVVGGFEQDPGGLIAWTLGNLLFDQTVWPTFESYLLTVYVRDGVPIRAVVDPLIIDDFRPQPLVGALAAHVARDAAGWAGGAFVVEDGAVEIGDPGAVQVQRTTVAGPDAADAGIVHLLGATQLDPTTAATGIEAGRDLLWTGDFEDDVADGTAAPGPLWLADGDGRSRLHAAASRGEFGIRLDRVGSSNGEVVLLPIHRIPVAAGTSLTFLASVRLTGGAPASLQLSWYNALRGASSAQTTIPIAAGEGWQTLRVDITVPVNAVAVLPIIRMGAPASGHATLDVDDERLIAWGPSTAASLATDYLRVQQRSAMLDLLVAGLPGWAQPAAAYDVVSTGPGQPAAQPADLPAGPTIGPEDDD
ncbi:MAG TPA: CapA family protein [Candidatus Limnocylindrales bacterium]|nr:CapA family protein [Candidatus Limnocylindrales bacterium]